MSDINMKCLETFPGWLRTLDEDVQAVLTALRAPGVPEEPRRFLAGGINYLFKSLDLIPDGIDDIGYLDDAFVLRLSARAALDLDLQGLDGETMGKLGRMSNDCDLVRELLGDELYARLEKYVRDLRKGAARGRTVDEILGDEGTFKLFAAEADGFVKEYQSPGFSKDEKNLIKLKAFLEAKLPK
jgi:uncharacterized membrane protein YkvA (DUF1232 family)